MAISKPARSRDANTTIITESDLQKHSQELGMFGALFGSKENAAIYLAGIIGFASLIGVIAIGIWGTASADRGDLIKSLVGIVVASITFIGGASGRGTGNS